MSGRRAQAYLIVVPQPLCQLELYDSGEKWMRSAASAKQNDTRLYGYGPSRKLNQHCSGKTARSVAGAA
jgi:hypothetical protein